MQLVKILNWLTRKLQLIPIPQDANTITDFEAGVDVIGIAGTGLSFEDISFKLDDGNTVINLLNQDVAILLGMQGLGESDFAFV